MPGGSQAFAIAERLGLPERIVEDARSRLTDTQRSLEQTLTALKATEGETSASRDKARTMELRSAETLREAAEDRRRARRERDEIVDNARKEAERILDRLRDEVRVVREALQRESITAPSVDAALAEAEAVAAELPAEDRAPEPSLPPTPRAWRLGDRARSLAGGWQGRIVALERSGTRASLEAGGIRVMVDVDDLVPAIGGATDPADPGSAVTVDRSRSVALSLDLRGARVDEAMDALDRYLDEASLASLGKVVIIHGQGTGALRDAVRRRAGDHVLVTSVRAGHRGEGGDGATIVEL